MLTRIATWYQDSPFSTATLIDWLDIAILAWLIYRGLMLIRGTRGQQSLLGVVMLGAGYLAADYLGFTTLHWILESLFVYIVLALLILFQDDIRLGLARAGGTLFARAGGPSDANILEEIIQAVFALAHRKVGALIALERTANLRPFVGGAHVLEARVSAEILQAIFHPSSPIHDGAVVLAGDKLVAAGVFLPISLSKEISRAYGTRHRAAIGLTEVTDAVCIVVSEERGTVAIVQGGTITPVADADDLRGRLSERLEAPAGQADSVVLGGS